MEEKGEYPAEELQGTLMLLRSGKILGELGVTFSPRLQNALSIAKQNKNPGASDLLTPAHQQKEREITYNTLSNDQGLEGNKETLSKFDEVQEKSNSIMETPVRPKTSKVTVEDPSTGTVASKPQQTYQLWGNPIFSNVNKNLCILYYDQIVIFYVFYVLFVCICICLTHMGVLLCK